MTGLGLITPIARGRGLEVWDRFLAGSSGIKDVRSFDTAEYSVHRGAEIHDFNAEEWLRVLEPRSVGRASQLAASAARLALDDAGLNSVEQPERAGVAMGTTSGEPLEVERFDDRHLAGQLGQVDEKFVGRYPCHVIAENVASEVGFSGENTMIPTACAAGNYAVAHAYEALRDGRADVMLAGGADAFSRITFTGFASLGAIAPERCQPFDRDRQGMIPGEGAAVLVLEPLERARRRDARIYAEVAGFGLTCDAHHMTGALPDGGGAVRAMRQALAEARVEPGDVSYVSAHGTGTPSNDRVEAVAFKRVFADSTTRPPTSSVKSMIGHTMGAASAIEAAICSLAISTNRIPPTINLEQPDPECDFDCVPNTAREHRVDLAMNNAYAFGGNNASVVFRRSEK